MKIRKFLSQSPIFSFYLAASEIIENVQKNLVKHDVHFLQGLILTALLFEEREVRPFELSQDFQVGRSTISHAIRGLERKGLLKRGLHPTDARGYVLSLTTSGKRKAVVLVKEFDKTHDGIENHFGAKKLREAVENMNEIRRLYRLNKK